MATGIACASPVYGADVGGMRLGPIHHEHSIGADSLVESRVPAGTLVDSVDDAVRLPLPVSRPLGYPPAVSAVGQISAADSIVANIPITAALAVHDLRTYAGQLDTRYPISAIRFPVDSLHPQYVARADAWVARLGRLRGPGVEGRQRIAMAMVAFQAERDTLAKQFLDERLAELAADPAERSLTLASAVELFADPTQEENRLARNLPVAMTYAGQLTELPASGYRTRSDSTNVRARTWMTIVTLVTAVSVLRDSAVLVAQADRLLRLVSKSHMSYDARMDFVRWQFPYEAVATVLARGPGGQARVDTLNAQLLRIARRADTEWSDDIGVADRTAMRAGEEQDTRKAFRAFAMLGQPAPAVVAHAWLNTADSSYGATPRAHSLADGIIRVLVFGRKEDERLAMLDLIQRQFRDSVQVVFVTETEGHAGPDLVTPAEEVAWLHGLYVDAQRVSFPIAIWAGAKVTHEPPVTTSPPSAGTIVVSDGRGGVRTVSPGVPPMVRYQRFLPSPSPVPDAYRAVLDRGYSCVIVDGHGIIRGYERGRTAAQLRRLLTTLHSLRGVESSEHSLVRP